MIAGNRSRPSHRSSRTPATLGDRIRKARMDLKLSLAQVAKTDFSRAYLNQIELGRAQPSTRILQIIAQRLGRPVEYFLQDPEVSGVALELRLAEAATRIRQNDAEKARDLITELLARHPIAPEIRLRGEVILAEALLKLPAVPEAIEVLRTAIRRSSGSGPSPIQVELYHCMGMAHYLLRHPHEAGRWWDKALGLYEEIGLVDPLLKARILGHRANLYYVAGQPREAIAGYQSAIAAAENLFDMQALAGIYEGLAMSLWKTGNLALALDYAQRSLRLFDTVRDTRMSAKLRNNMAEIFLSQRRIDEAEELFLAGAEQLRRVGDRDLLPHLLAGGAEAALERGDRGTAAARVAEALEGAMVSADPLAKLVAERVAGRVSSAAGHNQDARAHFERALEIAETLSSSIDISRVAFDYAQALEQEGDATSALLRYRQAYRAREAADAS